MVDFDKSKVRSNINSAQRGGLTSLGAALRGIVDAIVGDTTLLAPTVKALTFDVGGTINVDSAAVAATGDNTTQTATVTKMAGTITTGALTTAANASTSVVLTLVGVAAGDLCFTTLSLATSGQNTTSVELDSAVCTTDTITIKIRNGVLATTALNGTVKFHYLWLKQ